MSLAAPAKTSAAVGGMLTRNDGGQMIDPARINRDGGTQTRAALDQTTVADYCLAMQDGATFPPITLYYDGSDYWLADGFHRLEAHLRRPGGIRPIRSEVRQGTRRDAVLHSVAANAQHGLRRTRADKRRAVEMLLRDDEWAKWSDREIGRRCHVSPTTVGTIRAELAPSLSNLDSERKYTDRYGNERTMNTEEIGRIRRDHGSLAGVPDAQRDIGEGEFASAEAIIDWLDTWLENECCDPLEEDIWQRDIPCEIRMIVAMRDHTAAGRNSIAKFRGHLTDNHINHRYPELLDAIRAVANEFTHAAVQQPEPAADTFQRAGDGFEWYCDDCDTADRRAIIKHGKEHCLHCGSTDVTELAIEGDYRSAEPQDQERESAENIVHAGKGWFYVCADCEEDSDRALRRADGSLACFVCGAIDVVDIVELPPEAGMVLEAIGTDAPPVAVGGTLHRHHVGATADRVLHVRAKVRGVSNGVFMIEPSNSAGVEGVRASDIGDGGRWHTSADESLAALRREMEMELSSMDKEIARLTARRAYTIRVLAACGEAAG